jgi:hypothetical protein
MELQMISNYNYHNINDDEDRKNITTNEININKKQ